MQMKPQLSDPSLALGQAPLPQDVSGEGRCCVGTGMGVPDVGPEPKAQAGPGGRSQL